MKTRIISLCILILAECIRLHAQTYPYDDYRETRNTRARVTVFRDHNPPSKELWERSGQEGPPLDLQLLKMAENVHARIYHARVVVSVTQFEFVRNCHDYAWSPYMTTLWQRTTGNQKECWWMDDPRANWQDGSVQNLVTSRNIIQNFDKDYLFQTSDLDNIKYTYYNEFGPCGRAYEIDFPFPVCPLDNLNEIPAHTALLVAYTPTDTDPSYSYGTYRSKWGLLGIFEHRWGWGKVPYNYMRTDVLRIFVPYQGNWGYDPPPYLAYWPLPFGPPW